MKDIARLAVVLTAIAAVAGGCLAFVYDMTKEPIAAIRLKVKTEALKAVLPMEFDNDIVNTTVDVDGTVFNIAKKGDAIVGIALEVVAPDGYAGPITSVVGFSPDGKVTGIEVLNHTETPGLYDLYVTEEWQSQANGKDVNTDWRVIKDGGVFESKTGATVTPRAILASVGKGLKFFDANKDKILK